MGLDADAYKVKGENREPIAYWRNHRGLDGFMGALYKDKGGTEEFAGVDLELTEKDLGNLEEAIHLELKRAKAEAPKREAEIREFRADLGGKTADIEKDIEPEDWVYYEETDQEFIRDAREALNDGWRIVYTCSW